MNLTFCSQSREEYPPGKTPGLSAAVQDLLEEIGLELVCVLSQACVPLTLGNTEPVFFSQSRTSGIRGKDSDGHSWCRGQTIILFRYLNLILLVSFSNLRDLEGGRSFKISKCHQ